jgi:DNA-binding NarL/FixJ family response regulator
MAARHRTTPCPTHLTPTHAGIAACLLDGMMNKEIGAAMGKSERAIEAHIRVMRERLDCPTSRALIVRLVRMADA